MELLLELLLTMVLSVLIAFLLGKIVSVGAPEGDDPDAAGAAERAAAPSSPRLLQSSALGVSSKEVVGKAEAIGGIRVGLLAEGAEEDCGGTDGDRGVGEIVHHEEEGMEGGVGVSVEARAEELRLEEAEGGEKMMHGAAVEEAEAEETIEEVGRVVGGLDGEEEVPLAKDAARVVEVALPPDEEDEVAKELDSGEIGTESMQDGERPAMVESDDVKIVPCEMAMGVGLESGYEGPETSVRNEKVGSLFNEDDDWEGIEKSDLEKLFAAATAFVGSSEGSEALAKLSNDLQMQLYGLHKVATEGPCYESQPMPIKVSARAKWHAWQRLGSMNPDVAMEQYIMLVSDNVPGWMPKKNGANNTPTEGEGDSHDKRISSSGVASSSSSLEDQLFQKNERKLESHSYIGECNVPVVSKGTEQGETVTDSSLA